MTQMSGLEQFYEVVRSEGVRYLFANPGTTELPIFDALAGGDTGVEVVFALHESTAVAAADAYSQVTHEAALVNLHIAPGVANGLANLFNAFWARSPLVITTGQQNLNQIFQEPLLAADLVEMTRQFCKWSYEVKRVEDVGPALRRAFKIARTPPTGPVMLSIPWNHLDERGEVSIPERSEVRADSVASKESIEALVEALASAQNPAMIAGDEIARRQAIPAAVEFAEALGLPVYGEPMHGRLVFPMSHPQWKASLPPINSFLNNILSAHDVVFAVGAKVFAPFLFSSGTAVPESTRILQLDTDAYEIAKNYAVEQGVVADIAPTLDAIREAMTARKGFSSKAKERRDQIEATSIATRDAFVQAVDQQKQQSPLSPLAAAMSVIDAFEGHDVTVIDESVSATTVVRVALQQRDPDSYMFFRGGSLGWAAPATVGAALGAPDRKIVAFSGDGALCYVPQSLWTLAHHGLDAVIVVLNNTGYQILKQQMLGYGGESAKKGVYPAMDIVEPAVDFEALSRAFGVSYRFAEKADEVTSTVSEALQAGGAWVIEVPVDPTVTPLAVS